MRLSVSLVFRFTVVGLLLCIKTAGYIIRSIPTTSVDRIYCKILAHNAVHAAFGGFTGVVVGLVNTHYVYLPIPIVIQAPRRVDPKGKKWNQLLASIGQPDFS